MIANNFKKRSLSDQTGDFSYELSISLNNTTGNCSFGFSGDYLLDFYLSQGKVYDSDGKYLASYEKEITLQFSGDVSTDSDQLFLNGDPIYFQRGKPTGRISYFYIDPSNVEAQFDLFVYGEQPDYYYSTTGEFDTGDIIEGHFINNNPDIRFRIFSGEILEESNFLLSGITEGDIDSTGYFYLVAQSNAGYVDRVPLRFYTNFGEIDFTFVASGKSLEITDGPDIYLEINDSYSTFIPNNNTQEYLINFRNPHDALIRVSLEYFSGQTGDIFRDVEVTDFKYAPVQGEITGEGKIVNYYEAPVEIIDASGNSVTETGSGYLTGYAYATGDILYTYKVKGTGHGTGYIYVDVEASGRSESIFSGYIPFFGGGILTGEVQNLEGTGSFSFGEKKYVAKGLMSEAFSEIHVENYIGEIQLEEGLDSSFYEEKEVSIEKAVQGTVSKSYVLVATGLVSGVVREGTVDDKFFANLEYGNYYFTKEFCGNLGANVTDTYNLQEVIENKPVDKTFSGWFEGFIEKMEEIRDCSITVPEIKVSGLISDCQDNLELLNCQNCDIYYKNWEFCSATRIKYFSDLLYNSRFWEFCNGELLQEFEDPVNSNGWTIDEGDRTGPPFEPPTTIINTDVTILIYVDTSGSMNNELPAIRKMVKNLKDLLRSYIGVGYDENQVQIIELGNERWAQWMAGTEATFIKSAANTNLIIFCYQNESNSAYHNVPFDGNKSKYSTDVTSLLSTISLFKFYQAKMFAIQPSSYKEYYEAFKDHLDDTIKNGLSPNISAELNVPAGRSAKRYLNEIIQILNTLGQ